MKRKLKSAFKQLKIRLRLCLLSYRKRSVQRKINCYCFVPNGEYFSGNMKAVFDYVKDNTAIKKVILTSAGKFLNYQSESTVVIHSQFNSHFHEASVVICEQMLHVYKFFRYGYLGQVPIVNIWHGIPMKKMFLAAQRKEYPFSRGEKEYVHMITSSADDAQAMNACFDLPPSHIHVTGLPRVDLLFSPTQDIEIERDLIKELTKGRHLILFAPTWRDKIDDYYQFSADEIERLSHFLKKNNSILGIREHFNTKGTYYFNQFENIGAISFGNDVIQNIEALLLEASVLITDYSSCYFDFLLLGKPTLCFAFDYDRYNSIERGFFYELNDIFEKKIGFSFDEVIDEMENLLESEFPSINQTFSATKNQSIIDRFFQFKDTHNTKRVISLIERLAKEATLVKN